MALKNAPVFDDSEWLSVLRYSTLVSIPVALEAASKLKVFDILAKHSKLSAHEIIELIPAASNPEAAALLDRVLCLLSSEALPSHAFLSSSWEADTTTNKKVRRYALLPDSKYFLTNEAGFSEGQWYLRAVAGRFDILKLLDKVILEGGSGSERVFGHTISEHVAHHSAELSDAMTSLTAIFMNGFLQAYDGFSNIDSLVDIGGSTGTSLKHILEKYPHLQGINFDQAHIVASAPVYPRLKHVGGNMLESVPAGDAIFMKLILHDWEDDECIKILSNCKQAITGEHGKVVVADFVKGSISDSAIAHQMDVLMISSHGNKARGLEDYRQLGLAAGFSEVKVACIINELTVLEYLM